MRKLAAGTIAIGLLSSISLAVAAPPAPPPPNLGAMAHLPPVKFKVPPQGPTFLSLAEIQKHASVAAMKGKKTIKPAPTNDNSVTLTLMSQTPGGYDIELISPRAVEVGRGRIEASFAASMSQTFAYDKGHATVLIPTKRDTVYVVECSIGGGPTPVYHGRLSDGGGTTEIPSSTLPLSVLVPHDGWLDVDVQGYLSDGDQYGWTFNACKVTTFPYG